MAGKPDTNKKSGKLLKKLVMLGGALVLGLVLLGGGVFLGPRLTPPAHSADSGEEAEKQEPKKKAVEPETGTGPMLTLKERVVNLSNPTVGGPRFVKFAATVEFIPEKPEFYKLKGAEKKKAVDDFQKTMVYLSPLIEDALVTVVSAKQASDLQNSTGRERLKLEALQRISSAVAEPEVVNVYFTEFVMQ